MELRFVPTHPVNPSVARCACEAGGGLRREAAHAQRAAAGDPTANVPSSTLIGLTLSREVNLAASAPPPALDFVVSLIQEAVVHKKRVSDGDLISVLAQTRH